MYIWPEFSNFLQFIASNNERLAQNYSAWKWLAPLCRSLKLSRRPLMPIHDLNALPLPFNLNPSSFNVSFVTF